MRLPSIDPDLLAFDGYPPVSEIVADVRPDLFPFVGSSMITLRRRRPPSPGRVDVDEPRARRHHDRVRAARPSSSWVENRLEAVVRTAAERASERTARAWRDRVPGRALLECAPELERASSGLEEAAADEVRAWQGVVFDLVREEGASKRTTARLASLGVNGAGLTVMLAVFAHTGGLTGGEIVVAGGTSAVGQKVLEAIFGDQAVRTLAARAREDLIERVDRLLRAEAKRFDVLLDRSAPQADSFARLHAAVDAIRRAA